MSFLKSVKSIAKKSYDILPAEYRGFGNEPMHFWQDNTFQHGHRFAYTSCLSAVDAFRKCPPLAAVIIRMAQAYINGKTWIMNTQGKEATSEPAKKLRKLLAKPNPLQSWKEFEAQQEIYMDMFGWFFLLPIIPVGFEQYGPIEATSLWNIAPNIIDVKETEKLFYQTDLKGIVESVKLKYKSNKTQLKVESLYLFKDFVPSFDTMVFPDSRIRALEMPINNIIGAYESRNVLINYRGALGAFTQEPPHGQYVGLPLTDPEKIQLQKDFQRYGLKNEQWKFIITTAALKWQQIGIPTKDLMLFEEISDDIMRICDAYGFPSPLINSEKGPAVSNTKEFKAQLYQDATIPRSESMYEQWNQVFRLSEYNIRIEKDYSHVAVLQQDELTKAQARKERNQALIIEWQNDMITMNRWLFLNGEDTRGEDGDIYYSEWKKTNQPTATPTTTTPAANA